MATFTAQYWLGSTHHSTEFEADERLRDDSEQLEETGNSEAEIRYDGLKYFIVNAIY